MHLYLSLALVTCDKIRLFNGTVNQGSSVPGLFRSPIEMQYKLTCGGRNSPTVLAFLYALQLVHATRYKFETGTVFGIEFSMYGHPTSRSMCKYTSPYIQAKN